jgi:hypothetical protein
MDGCARGEGMDGQMRSARGAIEGRGLSGRSDRSSPSVDLRQKRWRRYHGGFPAEDRTGEEIPAAEGARRRGFEVIART